MTSTLRRERLRVSLQGAVQGVGFRPFVYRLAREMGLFGWVSNSSAGLDLEVDGDPETLRQFLRRLEAEKPAAAGVVARDSRFLAPAGFTAFEIRPSSDNDEKTASILPDLATCSECLSEMIDPADRRFGYAFTNCTQCGPRYTIIEDIPYDRPHTTMRAFEMCSECAREYREPRERRFHAQPNACPDCGPRLSARVDEAADALRAGQIVAVKGIGGFQLLVDARSEPAVERLRRLKRREAKPFALMVPTIGIARRYCRVSEDEEAALKSTAAPIVLLRPKGDSDIAPGVARHSPYLGIMLPYSPLHHLLMRSFPFPVVATSGNRSDEPIAIDNDEARQRLAGIADFFLTHDRPIARPCDDSVVRVARGREFPLRRARGYAPLPVLVGGELPRVLAVGGHLKNTVAIGLGRQAVVSQHIGDLDTPEARSAFERAIDDLCRLYRFGPEVVACDLHPDYASSHWAANSGLPVIRVQHHQAHVAGCAAENDVHGAYLGVGWDGTGFGLDGTIWGGEMFLVEEDRYVRAGHLRPFRLPGGEAAVRQGWRSAAGVRWELEGVEGIAEFPHAYALEQMLRRGVNSPVTSSAGRLFDAVAAIADVAAESRFEGEAAMLLERAIDGLRTGESYPLPVDSDGIADWGPMVERVVSDRRARVPKARIAARFHNALVGWILEAARRSGVRQVVLSGGVFQNSYLLDRAAEVLEGDGFAVFTHRRVPANDGGISLGQAVLTRSNGACA